MSKKKLTNSKFEKLSQRVEDLKAKGNLTTEELVELKKLSKIVTKEAKRREEVKFDKLASDIRNSERLLGLVGMKASDLTEEQQKEIEGLTKKKLTASIKEMKKELQEMKNERYSAKVARRHARRNKGNAPDTYRYGSKVSQGGPVKHMLKQNYKQADRYAVVKDGEVLCNKDGVISILPKSKASKESGVLVFINSQLFTKINRSSQSEARKASMKTKILSLA